MDKLHMALTELSYSINYVAQINVWDYTFAPRYEMPFDEFFQSFINRSNVQYELANRLDRFLCLRCRWAPLGPRIRPGWKHQVFRNWMVRKYGETFLIYTSSVYKV